MKDIHIVQYVGSNFWALCPEKWAELLPVLIRHVKGERLTAAELQAVLARRTTERDARPSARGVAVIPIHGVIAHRMDALQATSGGTSIEAITSMFRAALADERVEAIMLDVDSPGGTVTGVSEFAAELFAARGRKPILAVANGLMASAAYWLAAQAEEIVTIPSGMTGSIGVFSVHEDLSAALEQEGIKMTLIKAGKFKVENNPFEPMTDEGRAHIQGLVDEAYGWFAADVARGRGVDVATVRNGFGEGRLLSAEPAQAAGLVDRIETMDTMIGRWTGGARGAPASARTLQRRLERY